MKYFYTEEDLQKPKQHKFGSKVWAMLDNKPRIFRALGSSDETGYYTILAVQPIFKDPFSKDYHPYIVIEYKKGLFLMGTEECFATKQELLNSL